MEILIFFRLMVPIFGLNDQVLGEITYWIKANCLNKLILVLCQKFFLSNSFKKFHT